MNISKVPCLAIIISDHYCPINTGKIVKVIKRVNAGDRVEPFRCDNQDCWLIESVGSLLHWNNIDGSAPLFVRQRFILDGRLREIKGDDDSINTDTTEPINEEVKA